MSDDEDGDEKMGLSGCGKFLKYSMFMFNSVILVAGCGLLGFGVYVRNSEEKMAQLATILGSFYYTAFSTSLIVLGGVVIVISFLGCCGAIKEVKCMLGTFFVLLFVMLLSMVIGGIIVYVYRENIGDAVLTELSKSLNTTYGVSGDREVTKAWDLIQKLFQCCGVSGGVNSTTSWAYYREYTFWFKNQTDDMREYVPESCCRNVFGNNRTKCVGGSGYENIIPAILPPVGAHQENDLLYTNGCYTAIVTFLTDNVRILAGVASAVSVLMVLGMTFAICLCRRIKDDFLFD
ncbi:tetraspanin-9-like isoform X2 [Biomphalaria glabrata]|uniref:Tetraspanin n=1 Tax=Biomphalaria glabrata TaxID=6526 RepID=A0A9W3A4B8_BIOGL|nr:tetraspanin-9-like isoform X2 [Biomphalaria glabrata]XP_055882025.1 tetraspanin-9-like isoform X2 [Biomphalaria glabrata]